MSVAIGNSMDGELINTSVNPVGASAFPQPNSSEI